MIQSLYIPVVSRYLSIMNTVFLFTDPSHRQVSNGSDTSKVLHFTLRYMVFFTKIYVNLVAAYMYSSNQFTPSPERNGTLSVWIWVNSNSRPTGASGLDSKHCRRISILRGRLNSCGRMLGWTLILGDEPIIRGFWKHCTYLRWRFNIDWKDSLYSMAKYQFLTNHALLHTRSLSLMTAHG